MATQSNVSESTTNSPEPSPPQQGVPVLATKMEIAAERSSPDAYSRLTINGWERTTRSREPLLSQRDAPTTDSNSMVFTLPANAQASSRIIIADWKRTLRTSPQPSRPMRLPTGLETTAAGPRRSGLALPRFLPSGATPTQALDISCTVDPFGRSLNLKLSTLDRCNYKRVGDQPKTIKSNRQKVILELTHLAISMRPMQGDLEKVSGNRPPCESSTHPANPLPCRNTGLSRQSPTEGHRARN